MPRWLGDNRLECALQPLPPLLAPTLGTSSVLLLHTFAEFRLRLGKL